MPVSARFPSFQTRPLPLLVTAGLVHRREIPSRNQIALHCRRTGNRSPTASRPVPTTSAPNVARKFGLRSTCLPVQDRHAPARAIHPTEPTLGPRHVSLSVHGVSPSPGNFSATRADTNAAVLFPGGPHRDPAVPAARRRTPESDLELLPACSRCV